LVDAVSLQGRGGAPAPMVDSLEFDHHLDHLAVVDAGRIPLDAIGGLTQAAPNLTLSHATNELLPGGLALAAVLNTRLSGIVQKLIVADPQGSVPGFVVSPAVVGVLHGLGRLVDVFSLQGQGSPATIPCASLPSVTLCLTALEILCFEAIIEIEDLAWHVLNFSEQGVGFHWLSRLVCCNSTGSVGAQRVDLCHLLSCHTVQGLGGLQDGASGLAEHQQHGSD